MNTASVSYRDVAGDLLTHASNTVTVLVASALLAPVIEGFNPFNFDLHLDDTLSVQLSGGAPDQLNWVFTPGSTPASGNASILAAPASASLGATTAAPALTLSAVTQLSAGAWHVSVTATNSAGTSAPVQGDFVLVLSDLSSARVFPNPWRKDKHDGRPITFDQLSGNVTVKIFTVSGRLLKDLGDANGHVTWDLTNNSGDMVASGIYIYLITDNQGNKTKGKLAIIR